MKKIGSMISRIRKERKMTQDELARRVFCTKQSISNYERDLRRPDYETLENIADVLNVPIGFFLSKEEVAAELSKEYSKYPVSMSLSMFNEESRSPSGIRVPVLGSIPAGIPMEAIQDILDWEEIPAEWARGGKEYFALKVTGDSMYPRYEVGDVIIVHKQDTCESGQDCVVMVNGDDATFKRVKLMDNGLMLQPINPSYDPLVFTSAQVAALPVRILGVVVQLRRDV